MNDTIAANILAQLGGNQFLAMTGARNLVSTENSLTIKLPRPSKRSCVVITLAADDTYTVEAYTGTGFKMAKIDELSGIYADSLRRTFTALTGLHCTL